tara:strand:- start:413 stop:850 length:438 start_codon:yes stop_codon:yes gene_type:complete
MKQFVKIFLGFFAIGVFFAIVFASLNKAQADEVFPPDLLKVQSVPVYCGNSFEVLVTTMNTFKMELLGSSNVTVQGQPDGRLLGTMSVWYNTENRKGVFYLTIPQTGQTCLLSYGIDWVFDTEILLDVVNDSLANVSKLPDIEVE